MSYGLVEDLSVHRFRNLVIGIVLYARYKFWIKGLDEKVCEQVFNMIISKDFSMWGNVINYSRFDKKQNDIKSLWKKHNIIDLTKL